MEFINYGIDLGTTNSCIARFDGVDLRVFQNNDQMSVTPSAVYLHRSGRTLVGKRAYGAIVDDPDNVAREFKRWIGQKDRLTYPASGRTLSAEELSAEVLRSLIEDADRQTGERLDSAVIAVPAAFSVHQCEATSRAARLVGITESPLLQEPISAAIAYGISPGARDQRWLVFDLGGGTLDIAVISTRDGKLSVIGHAGANQLGGKDIDRLIVDVFFIPPLSETFALPPVGSDEYRRLHRRLTIKAEEAKIDLSSRTSVIVALVNVGNDRNGNPIDLDVALNRTDVERIFEPIFARSCALVDEALKAARVTGGDLDRILLVGGPTQMPLIRNELGRRIGTSVDYSIDPMTVVARGAAIYASTIERGSVSSLLVVRAKSPPGKVGLRLAFEPVSAATSAPVAGRFESSALNHVAEVKIDAEGGYWTSGWVRVQPDGMFEFPVVLREGKTSSFFVYARDASGRLLDLESEVLSIRHGLVVSAPPLPHSILVELAGTSGKTELATLISRSMPLPQRATTRFRAARTLRPSEPGTSLAIKIWEGENLTDAGANTWIGNLSISSDDILRPIPEGSEIELTILMDASRQITVEAFVSRLNQHFKTNLWAAEREEQSLVELAGQLPKEIETHMSRLDAIQQQIGDDAGLRSEFSDLLERVESLDLDLGASSAASDTKADPDLAKRRVEESRDIRAKLSKLEEKTGAHPRDFTNDTAAAMRAMNDTTPIVNDYGTVLEQKELALLLQQLERAIDKADARGVKTGTEALSGLRMRVLVAQDWFWKEIFESLRSPSRNYISPQAAARLISEGDAAVKLGNGTRLREVVRGLWDLEPKSEEQDDKEKAFESGIRRA